MSDRLKPAFLFIGDPFLIDEKLKSFLSALSEKIKGEISVTSHDLSAEPLETILAAARTLPFLTSFQVFRLRGFERLKESHQADAESYLKNPSETSVLIFEAAELGKSDKWAGLIQKYGEVNFFEDAAKQSAAASFLKEKLARSGKTMNSVAAGRLQEMTGENPAFMESLLERLILFAGDQKEITEEMVETFEEDFSSVNVFQLTDAIAAKNTALALTLLKKLMDEGEREWISLLGLLHWQMRRFWQAKVLQAEGESESLIAKKCKLSPRQAPFFMRQLKLFSRAQLERTLEGLFQLDWKIKTGRIDGPLGFETWVVKTTS